MKIKILMLTLAAVGCLAGCNHSKKAAQEWASKLLDDKGIEIPFHPSTNFVELKRQYEANQNLWDAALDCVAKTAPVLGRINDYGTTELVGKDCYAVYSEYVPHPFEGTKLEGHKDYIDIQLTEGPVRWGICQSKSKKLEVLEEYDPDKDAGFYLSEDTVYYTQDAIAPSLFVFFPSDLHNPSFALEGVKYPRPLKKLVVKIKKAE